MKRAWTDDELADVWTIHPDERQVLANKTGATRLGFAVLMKFFQGEGRFPRSPQEVPPVAVDYLANQVEVAATEWTRYEWEGRTIKFHRGQIRDFLGFREATVEDGRALTAWLSERVTPGDRQLDQAKGEALERCRELRVEPPAPERLDRLVRAAIYDQELRFCAGVLNRLTSATREQLDVLLQPSPGGEEALLHSIRAGCGRAGIESITEEVDKLERLREIALPADLFPDASPATLRTYRQRVEAEEARDLRRHPEPLRATLLAVFCQLRSEELVDTLVELLAGTVHRIETKAERKVGQALLEDLKRVSGKTGLLYRMAEASLAQPDGSVREVVFPVIGEQTLQRLVKEAQATGGYRHEVHAVMRASYRSHYRRMLPLLLRSLEFRSNNEVHRPVIRALELIRKFAESKVHYYPAEEDVPIEGVVPGPWLETVVEKGADGTPRVNRLTYEMCVLQAARVQLRCKSIWVPGANHYRNPDDDLPKDFEDKRETYYQALVLPREAETFVAGVRQRMEDALRALDEGLPENRDVTILKRAGGWIRLSPLEAQPEPVNIVGLKAELARRWPMTSLLDMVKEADLRIHFTDALQTAAVREHLDRSVLQPRILLCLYGLGSNTGLKRVGAGTEGVSYKDLLYVRRRFITKGHLRQAIAMVVNATLRARNPLIWGEGTTACASDSKKFGAWDQNLMTEWHVRYGGRGVMIYWHVERKAACIYSQLKTCSSSEVAAMIEGVLHHNTEMEVGKNYVDTHGQSTVAFAFCRLLSFQLLPRFKAIHSRKLYRPVAGRPDDYPNLQPVLTRPIEWESVTQQYDQMVKFTTALRVGTAAAEDILRRFDRNSSHPAFKALLELGRAEGTTFTARYLACLPLRREIEEGLNVVENWNSANGFIHFGRGGEMATNRVDDLEVGMLTLHLLQACLVYVNTLMLQRVLGEQAWSNRLTAEDLRALTPLSYGHVNPYGTFHLDMATRLAIEADGNGTP